VRRHRGIDDEATIPCILLERTLEDRVVAIRLLYRRCEVIDDQPAHDAVKERPRVLQTCDDILDSLRVGEMQILVPAERESHQHSPDGSAASGLRIENQPEPSEVEFGCLTRLCLGHADGDVAVRQTTMFDREAVERAVGNAHAFAR
jgi:hypothetical protein